MLAKRRDQFLVILFYFFKSKEWNFHVNLYYISSTLKNNKLIAIVTVSQENKNIIQTFDTSFKIHKNPGILNLNKINKSFKNIFQEHFYVFLQYGFFKEHTSYYMILINSTKMAHLRGVNEYSVRQWSWRPRFNPESSYTKDSKNGTWCHLA